MNEAGALSSSAWNTAPSLSGVVNATRVIMVIDDSPTVRKIVEVSLQREGFTVESYPDGIEALRTFTHNPQKRLPDLILLDINLPKMNGYDIARYLREKPNWRQIPIVMLTRQDGVIDHLRARLVGAQAYLTKPCTTQMIVEIVKRNLGLPVAPVREQT